MERGNESRRLSDFLRSHKEDGPDEGRVGTIESTDDDAGVRRQTDRALVTVKYGSAGVYVNGLSAGSDRY